MVTLTDWYCLGIDLGQSLLDGVDSGSELATALGNSRELDGEQAENVLGRGQNRGQLFENRGEGTVGHGLELGTHRPIPRARPVGHMAAIHVVRLDFSQHERHFQCFAILQPVMRH